MLKWKFFIIWKFFILLYYNARAAKILIGYAPKANSHYRTILPFAQRLATAGHNVTIFHITDEPKSLPPTQKNISAIIVELHDKAEKEAKIKEIGERMWSTNLHGFAVPLISLLAAGFLKPVYIKSSKQIFEVLNTEWDLVICSSIFNGHTIGFVEFMKLHANTPYVIFHPTAPFMPDAYTMAMSQNWVTAPNLFLLEPKTFNDAYDVRSFKDRALNFLEIFGEMIASIFSEQIITPMAVHKLVGLRYYNHLQFLNDAAMHLTDDFDPINYPISHVTDILSVTANCATVKPLHKEYIDFIEDPNSKGTIYVAFGTFVPWDYAPLEKKRAFIDALAQLTDYRIIFSFKGVFPEGIPSHIRLVKWAPQFDILSHPKTKVFLTHGGLKSVKESLCSRTPMLVMPIFAEQNHNAKIVIRAGIGGAINKFYFDTAEVVNGLYRLLDDKAPYRQRIAKLHEIFLDRPIADLDRALHYINRVIRLQKRNALIGAKTSQPAGKMFFKRTAIQLNLFQFNYVEIAFALLSIIYIIKM